MRRDLQFDTHTANRYMMIKSEGREVTRSENGLRHYFYFWQMHE